MNRKPVLIGAIAAVVIAVVAGVFAYRAEDAKATSEVALRNETFLVRPHAPQFGEPTARVHIVEFMDPACETCREFYPLVKQMIASHPGAIRLSIRHLALHPGVEPVVRVLEASRAQGKYWETLAALLASQPRWVINHRANPDLIWPHLEGIGLDLEQLRRDAQDPEVTRRIAQDASDARALRVTMTPEYFVNGRGLPEFGYEPLNALVQDALARRS